MAIGDLTQVTVNGCSDLYCLDTGMYDTEEYGAVYVLDAERPAIVDTGIGTHYEQILDALDEIGIEREALEVIAVTHVHLDHAGGAGYIAEACPNAEVVVHEIGAPHLVDPERLIEGTKRAVQDQWEFYVEPIPVPEDRIREITDGDVVDLGDHELVAHHAPGHAPHQVVYHDTTDDAVYVADAAGIWVPELGRVRETSPPSNFDLEQCLLDVKMLQELEPETLLYPHFGPQPNPEEVLASYETVLPEWVAEVREKKGELGDDDAVVRAFVDANTMEPVWGERKARGETSLNVRGVLRYLKRE